VPAKKSHGQVSRASDSRPCDAEPRAGTGKIRAVQPYAVLGSPDSGCVPDTRRYISVAAARCPLAGSDQARIPRLHCFAINGVPVAEVAGALSRLDSGRRVGRGKAEQRCDHHGSTPALPCGRGMRILHIPGLPTLHLATVPTKDVTTAQRG